MQAGRVTTVRAIAPRLPNVQRTAELSAMPGRRSAISLPFLAH
jgi:hypothetical protein